MKMISSLSVAMVAPALLWLATGTAAAGGPAAAAEPAVEKVTVRAVAHFGFNRSAIEPQDQASLLAEVGAMKDVSWQTVTATGYTDNVGSPGYNARLGKRRAGVVKAYLTGKGLPPTLVRTASQGDAAPVAGNDTAEGRAQNRRTEVIFEGVRSAAK